MPLDKDASTLSRFAPAGTPGVLNSLKARGNLEPQLLEPSTAIGADRFPLHADSPLRSEHELLSQLLDEVLADRQSYLVDLNATPTGRLIGLLKPARRGPLLLASIERFLAIFFRGDSWTFQRAAGWIVQKILHVPFELDRSGTFDLLLFLAVAGQLQHEATATIVEGLLVRLESDLPSHPLSQGERHILGLLRSASVAQPPLGSPLPTIVRLTRLIGDQASFSLIPGEVWTDSLNQAIGALSPEQRTRWHDLLRHCLTATAARPSDKWLKTATKLVDALGQTTLHDALFEWLPLVSKGRIPQQLRLRHTGDTMPEENSLALRGLLWLLPLLPASPDTPRLIAAVALSAYKKVPGIGPRAIKVGNAAIYALSQLHSREAVGQLAMLKVRVKFGTAQKEIEKAFTTAAEALGLPREEIEELGLPTYGLEEVGHRRELFADGAFIADLTVSGPDVDIRWSTAEGKSLKSPPARVKADHKDDLKELQTAAKDIAAMLPAQAQRLDSLFLQQKSWPLATWRERYLDHPLVGTLARRLIWILGDTPALFHDGRFINPAGAAVTPPDTATVTLWHPLGRPIDEVLAWRACLDRLQVQQPFKQAHRELYLLTDAERRTHTYSNRFAAHILRQHQFHALCAARGWRNKLRLMVDDSYPPASRELPIWNLRAEFWIEGIGANYGVDTNESGAFLRLATDQVRFYCLNAAENAAHAGGGSYTIGAAGPGENNVNLPLPLDQIPPLVLSEILRDVDLFVGVASVGNDPAWRDGGPEGRFQTYWQAYSFGDLSESAKTRKDVLATLLPRLKIVPHCSLSDKFLIVEGSLRTYKIHLGSGNILMEPNDQYLCIVADRSSTADNLFLPFEGDATLSLILSKAFLLANDKKITDPTITRQITLC